MLRDAQIPQGVEAFPNPEERIVQTVGRGQIVGERVAANQCGVRPQKKRKRGGGRGENDSQGSRNRQRDLPVWPGCEFPRHGSIVAPRLAALAEVSGCSPPTAPLV